MKFTNSQGSSTSKVADYANPVRLYASSSIKIECSQMTKIVFTCGSGTYATALGNSIGDTATVDGSTVTVTFTEAVDLFDIAKLTAQVRVNSITVTHNTNWVSPDPEGEIKKGKDYLDAEMQSNSSVPSGHKLLSTTSNGCTITWDIEENYINNLSDNTLLNKSTEDITVNVFATIKYGDTESEEIKYTVVVYADTQDTDFDGYYKNLSDVTGEVLKQELRSLITSTHTTITSYDSLKDHLQEEMSALITIKPVVELKEPGSIPQAETKAKRVNDLRPKDV